MQLVVWVDPLDGTKEYTEGEHIYLQNGSASAYVCKGGRCALQTGCIVLSYAALCYSDSLNKCTYH